MQQLLASVAEKKAELDRLRPLTAGALTHLRKYFDVELTYTSNAIEGNTLTHRETAEVIEHGITVAGKPLRDHLEAQDHFEALQWMRELASQTVSLDEAIVCDLHRRIVLRSQPAIAGIYSAYPQRIAGSSVVFPNPVKIPALMEEFGLWLRGVMATAENAIDAHFRLTAIHPFSDGNGRTARLLMNLILIRAGYPPVPVGPPERLAYLEALERASLSGDLAPFLGFMFGRLDATLETYISLLKEGL